MSLDATQLPCRGAKVMKFSEGKKGNGGERGEGKRHKKKKRHEFGARKKGNAANELKGRTRGSTDNNSGGEKMEKKALTS